MILTHSNLLYLLNKGLQVQIPSDIRARASLLTECRGVNAQIRFSNNDKYTHNELCEL